MKNYQLKTQYYETDQMGVIHHANYIRWFESARIDMMDQLGYTYKALEERGIASPVLAVACEYKAPCYFAEKLTIKINITAFNGIRLQLQYEVWGEGTDDRRAIGETSHAFLNQAGRIINLKKAAPDYYATIRRYQEQQQA